MTRRSSIMARFLPSQVYGPAHLVLVYGEGGSVGLGCIPPLNGINADGCLTSSGFVVYLSGMNSVGWENARSSGWY